MRVLVACEFSGVVREAFRERGHEAWSCDLLPALDKSPYHFKCDIFELLSMTEWDLMIAHPPCTKLAVCGNRWHHTDTEGIAEAVSFVKALYDAPIKRIAVENPVGRLSTLWRKPDQYVQPWMFGHKETKKTGLWLKNLPKLQPTNIVEGPYEQRIWKMGPSKDRGLLRSITYQGIADAMAEQWN
mgnify:CR=1 FL=1